MFKDVFYSLVNRDKPHATLVAFTILATMNYYAAGMNAVILNPFSLVNLGVALYLTKRMRELYEEVENK